MSVLKPIGIVFAAVVVIFFLIGWMLPGTYHVERSIDVMAPTAEVHALVGNLEHWGDWTPWVENDPTIQVTIGNTSTGVGAHQSWDGNSGKGELTFTSSDPETGISYVMSFEENKYSSTGTMTYEAIDGGTRVVWAMDGNNPNMISKWFGLFMNSSLVGPSFDKGLAKLKLLVESEA